MIPATSVLWGHRPLAEGGPFALHLLAFLCLASHIFLFSLLTELLDDLQTFRGLTPNEVVVRRKKCDYGGRGLRQVQSIAFRSSFRLATSLSHSLPQWVAKGH